MMHAVQSTDPAAPPASKLAALRRLLREVRQTFREKGFKGLVRTYGWKIFAAFFVYYLVRDVTIYIVIPWLVAKHFMEK